MRISLNRTPNSNVDRKPNGSIERKTSSKTSLVSLGCKDCFDLQTDVAFGFDGDNCVKCYNCTKKGTLDDKEGPITPRKQICSVQLTEVAEDELERSNASFPSDLSEAEQLGQPVEPDKSQQIQEDSYNGLYNALIPEHVKIKMELANMKGLADKLQALSQKYKSERDSLRFENQRLFGEKEALQCQVDRILSNEDLALLHIPGTKSIVDLAQENMATTNYEHQQVMEAMVQSQDSFLQSFDKDKITHNIHLTSQDIKNMQPELQVANSTRTSRTRPRLMTGIFPRPGRHGIDEMTTQRDTYKEKSEALEMQILLVQRQNSLLTRSLHEQKQQLTVVFENNRYHMKNIVAKKNKDFKPLLDHFDQIICSSDKQQRENVKRKIMRLDPTPSRADSNQQQPKRSMTQEESHRSSAQTPNNIEEKHVLPPRSRFRDLRQKRLPQVFFKRHNIQK